MKSKIKLLFLLFVLVVSMAFPITANAAVKLNKTKLTITVGENYTLKLKGTKKKVKWSSDKKAIATVSSKGVVNAKKVGKCNITAKVGSKKYTCKLTVKKFNLKKHTKKVKLTSANVDQYFEWQDVVQYNTWGERTSSGIALKWKNPEWYVIGVSNDYAIEYDLSYDYIWNGREGHTDLVVTEQVYSKTSTTWGYENVSNITTSFRRAKGTLTLVHKNAIKKIKYVNSSSYKKKCVQYFVLKDGNEKYYNLSFVPMFK